MTATQHRSLIANAPPRHRPLIREANTLPYRIRSTTLALALLATAFGAPSAWAQRPAPPKSWSIDTASGRPIGVRRGGALSSESKVELLGPLETGSTLLTTWLRDFASADASTLGTVDASAKDTVAVHTIAGSPVVYAAYSVRTGSATRYLTYAVLQRTAPGAPVIVMRSTFGDALTLVRVFRSSIESMLPFVLQPMESMKTAQPLAAGTLPARSLRVASGAPSAPDPAVAVSGTAVAADSGLATAISTGITDAIALFGTPADSATSAAAARPPAASATRSPRARNTPAAAPPRTPGTPAPDVHAVVFYQWGDLQFHPVALFTDGSSFDLDDTPIELLDRPRSRALTPRQWGRWRNAGTRYTLIPGGGGAASTFELGGGGLFPCFRAPPNTTLDGTYKAVSGSTVGDATSLLTSRFHFLPDGRFTDGRDFAATGSGDVSGTTMAAGSTSNGTGGRYLVAGHRIVLTYDSGETKDFFFAFSATGDPATLSREMIFIGRTAYVTDNR